MGDQREIALLRMLIALCEKTLDAFYASDNVVAWNSWQSWSESIAGVVWVEPFELVVLNQPAR